MILMVLMTATIGQAAPPANDDLSWFNGDWVCDGHFTPSNRPLASRMTFSRDEVTGATVKAHRDRPPATYAANETWAASRGGGFRMTIADSYSGLRWYGSDGWVDERWTWERQRVGAEPRERFIYIRTGPDRMTVEWWIGRGEAEPVMGDTLGCDRQVG